MLSLVDTVKRVEDNRVVETLDRSQLAAAQTPQGFRLEVLASAYEAAYRDRVTVTDEAMAVERMGAPVRTPARSPPVPPGSRVRAAQDAGAGRPRPRAA